MTNTLRVTSNHNLAFNRRDEALWASLKEGYAGECVCEADHKSYDIWLKELWRDALCPGSMPIMLTSEQELGLWRELIEEWESRELDKHPEYQPILNLNGTVERVKKAYDKFCAYGGKLSDLEDQHYGIDCEMFHKWAAKFEKLCDQLGMFPRCRLEEKLLSLLKSKSCWLNLPDKLVKIFYGIPVPAQTKLIEALEKQGVAIEDAPADACASRLTLAFGSQDEQGGSGIPFANRHEEVKQAALWLSCRLRERQNEGQEATAALIVPDLDQTRQATVLALDEALRPQSLVEARRQLDPKVCGQDPSAWTDAPYDISLGMQLNECTCIVHAIGWLRLCLDILPDNKQLLQLLTSPFLSGSEKQEQIWLGALLESRWREKTCRVIKLADVKKLLKECERKDIFREYAQVWRPKLPYIDLTREADQEDPSQEPGTMSTADWCDLCQSILYKLFRADLLPNRFSNNIALSSSLQAPLAVKKAFIKFFSILDQLKGRRICDFLLGRPSKKIGAENFMRQLEAACSRANVKALGDDLSQQPALKVLGVLEARGQHFDYAWVVGMDHKTWPPVALPLAYLPLPVQRDLKIPEALPSTYYQQYASLTEDLTRVAAQEVIFSFSQAGSPGSEDGNERHLSQLIADLNLRHSLHNSDCIAPRQSLFEQAPDHLEEYQEETSPYTKTGTCQGGTSILTDMAQCPFRAYVKHRLGLQPADDFLSIPATYNRGTIFHEIMRCFWLPCPQNEATDKAKEFYTFNWPDQQPWPGMRTSAQLHSWLQNSHGELRNLLNFLARKSLQHHRQDYPAHLQGAFLDVETDYMANLAYDWLSNIEAQRSQPFEVITCEYKLPRGLSLPMPEGMPWPEGAEAAPLTFNATIDRVDLVGTAENGQSLYIIDYKGSNKRSKWGLSKDGFKESAFTEPQIPLYGIFAFRNGSDLGLSESIPISTIVCAIYNKASQELKDAWVTADVSPAAKFNEDWQALCKKFAYDFRRGCALLPPDYGHSQKQTAKLCEYCQFATLCRLADRNNGWDISIDQEESSDETADS